MMRNKIIFRGVINKKACERWNDSCAWLNIRYSISEQQWRQASEYSQLNGNRQRHTDAKYDDIDSDSITRLFIIWQKFLYGHLLKINARNNVAMVWIQWLSATVTKQASVTHLTSVRELNHITMYSYNRTATHYSKNCLTHQIIKYIPLMHMNGDEGFKLDRLNLGEIAHGLGNQHIEYVEKLFVGGLHDLLIIQRLYNSLFGVTCPDHLKGQKTNLEHTDNRIIVRSTTKACWVCNIFAMNYI